MLTSLKLASLIGSAGLLVSWPDPNFYVTCGTLITVAGGLALQIIKGRQDAQKWERDRQDRLDHQAELKNEVARVATVAVRTKEELKGAIQENTILTREGINASNHVNDKFAVLAKAAGVTTGIQMVAEDTNSTVHRIEDRVDRAVAGDGRNQVDTTQTT